MPYNNDQEADEIVRRESAKMGISETMYRQLKVAPTDVVQSIVWDHIGKNSVMQPSSIIPENNRQGPVEPGTGWAEQRPLTKQPGIDIIDQMVEHQTQMERLKTALEALDADAAIRRARERREEK
jgi:hypothetical protein